jgi:hypothetical protein
MLNHFARKPHGFGFYSLASRLGQASDNGI